MFYAAKAVLPSVDVDARSHAGVLNQFSQHFIKTNRLDKKYGRMLALVMQARETSDYSPEVSVSRENAEAMIADAQTFVTAIRTYLGQ